MCKDQIIEKIQKLLAKTEANGATAAEAASAIAVAQKLMAQYGISIEETEVGNQNEIIEDEFSAGTKSVSTFQMMLANALAPHFACVVAMRKFYDGSQKILFIGERYKTSTFKECFNFAYNTYQKLSAKFLKDYDGFTRSYKTQARWDYFNGFVSGLTNELIKSENENALVIVKSDELNDYVYNMKMKTTTMYSRNVESYNNMRRGYEDGAFAYRNRNSSLNE